MQTAVRIIGAETSPGVAPSDSAPQRQVAVTSNGEMIVQLTLDPTIAVTGRPNNVDNVVPVATNSNLPVVNYNYIFDGTNFDRARSASAANLSLAAPLGAQLVAPVGNWAVFHQPAVSVRATITRAAGAAGVRHIATGFSLSLNAVGAITVPVVVNLRDGATGAGTILWTERFTCPVGETITRDLTGLSIFGTAATAMTFEFAAAPAAGDFQSVNLQGYSTG